MQDTLTSQRLDFIAQYDRHLAASLGKAIGQGEIRSAFLAVDKDEWSVIVIAAVWVPDAAYRARLKDRLVTQLHVRMPRERIAVISQTSDRGEIVRDARPRPVSYRLDRPVIAA